MSGRPPSPSYRRGPGEHAAAVAASYCRRRLGRVYAPAAWQLLADADRLGVIGHGRPEAWAAGAVVALARADGVLGAGGALAAQEIADELGVTLGMVAVTDRELAPSAQPHAVRTSPSGGRPSEQIEGAATRMRHYRKRHRASTSCVCH